MQLLIFNKVQPVVALKLYHRGDVVAVRPDDHEWGSKEGLPDFVIAEINDNINPDVLQWEKKADTQDFKSERVARRRFCVPAALLDQANADGRIKITINDIVCKHNRRGGALRKLLRRKNANLVEGEI